MTILSTPGQRRYLVRSAGTAAALFVVEAKNEVQAQDRAARIQAAGSLFIKEGALDIEDLSLTAIQVPHFLEGYFVMLGA